MTIFVLLAREQWKQEIPVLLTLRMNSEHPTIETCNMSFVPLPNGFEFD